MAADVPVLQRDQIVDGKYRVVAQLGQGGMGAVYEAIHVGTGRRVALKVIVSEALANEPQVLIRFEREAKASGAIASDHVVQILDTGIDPTSKLPYMVMEYLSGRDLSDLVYRVGPLDPDVVVRVAAQACLGLQRAHEANIVHRDIKSANLFLSYRDTGDVHVKVLDFGIAKVRADPIQGGESAHLTTTGAMIGSPLFMSPEQARSSKEIDARTDLWSLGVVMYEALTGKAPNHDKVTLGDLILAICAEPMPSLVERAPWVPPEIVAVVMRALERDPKNRFQSAEEMHAALVALAPNGTTIRPNMLIPLSEEKRVPLAPTPGTPVASPLAMSSAPGVQAVSSPGSSEAVATFGSSTGESTAEKLPVKRPHWALFAAPLVPLIGVATVFGILRSQAHEKPVESHGVVQQIESAPLPSATVMTSSSAVASKTAKVSILAPAGAKAELDGESIAIVDGAIEISGAPGSPHKIRLTHEASVQEADVTILENGTAIPAKVELVVKQAAVPVKTNPANPNVGHPATPKPAPTPPGSAAPTSNEPAIKKQF